MGKTHQGSMKSNKLSRSYRFKKRTGKIKKKDNNDTTSNSIKKARIVIRNLSFKTTEVDIRELYGPFGEIEEIKLLKRPDGKLVGCGFVQFKNITDASKAIFKTNKSEFLGRTISSEWAISKSQFTEKLKKNESEIKNDNETINDKNKEKFENGESVQKSKNFSKKNEVSKAEQRKLQKIKKRQKRSRIVIRNLPFTVTQESVKQHFIKYGNIEEIKILKKPDGTPIGCCFLQFDRVQSAAQAIHHENMKSFLNRSIVVDWAIPKDKFQKSNKNINCKENVNDEIAIKVEENENYDENEIKIKEENDSNDDEIKDEIDNTEEQVIDGNDSDIIISDNDDNDDDDDNTDHNDYDIDDDNDDDNDDKESINDKKDIKLISDNKSVTPHPRHFSNDVNEGKTVFIKNVPFSAKNEDLKQCMEQFGPVYYALICIDPLTEHSKGTAFVKFRYIEDAEKCLAAGTELQLHDQILDPHKAIPRDEVKGKSDQKKKINKDSRNLYLIKEGVILAATAAAQDVSASDMARRLQLEQWKSQMLRNLNMFISRIRLVIHNLPPKTDDAKLRQLFKNHSNPNAVITEARVMRDLRNPDDNGIGKSKEYGFVSFTSHEDALKALRSINNNPNIFTKSKRPIVAFSIENRIMVNAKKRRIEKSRQRNPLYNDRKMHAEKDQVTNDKVKGSKERVKRRKKSNSIESTEKRGTEENVESYAGITSKIGENRTTSRFFIKKQAQLHNENLKLRKKKSKNLKQLAAKRKEQESKKKEAKPKQGSKKLDNDEANFNRLVNSYKNKLSSISNSNLKWYET